MKKFELFSTDELRFIAALIAGREMINPDDVKDIERDLYSQIIFELRDRRITDENQRRLFLTC
jgi:hypothetical protein